MTREPIYAALFSLLSGAAGFNRKSRKLPHWNDVSNGEQPALFVIQKNEAAIQKTNFPTIWRLNVDVYLYVKSDDPSVAPSTIINPILDAVTNVLTPVGDYNQTLGGLVQYARISGAIETDEGLLGEQSVVIIPVEILTI
jgi:hypothetical protein